MAAANSEARKRLAEQGQHHVHWDPEVRELIARAWDEGFNSDYEGDGWPPNPYRADEVTR